MQRPSNSYLFLNKGGRYQNKFKKPCLTCKKYININFDKFLWFGSKFYLQATKIFNKKKT